MGLAPAWAIPLALKRAGLTPDRVDVWEVHEAFSAQALGVLRELSNQLGGFTIPDDNLSPNGGAVATGHPFGASGTPLRRSPPTTAAAELMDALLGTVLSRLPGVDGCFR